MGTRSITVIKNEQKRTLAVIYQQYDGYPEGWGRILLDFIKEKKMVNGIGLDKNVFNGIECFVAQLIAEFKQGPGGLYLYPDFKPRSRDMKKWYSYCWAEYVYEVDHELNVVCYETYEGKQVDLVEVLA